jgi:hypothetical protein
MMITRMALPRRTMLRGIGATVAVPWLEAMMPAFAAKAAAQPPKRFGVMYVHANGCLIKDFVPPSAGADFEMTPILRPFEKHRSQLTVVSGLANASGDPLDAGSGPHSRSAGCWLNGVRSKRTEGADLRAGRTADQFAADVLGKETPLRSMELGIDPNVMSGSCEGGYSCTYVNTFSWAAPDRPLPMETNPAVVFERLFGDGTSVSARKAQMRRERSILDSVTSEVASLERAVGVSDRHALGEYLDAVRDVERRIQQTGSRAMATTDVEKPYGVPAKFEDHATLMMDLMYLAFRTDMSRVVSFQFARELSLRSYPEIGVVEAHHDVSHHGNDPEKVAAKGKIDVYHMKLASHLLDRMANTKEGDGTLLDNSILLIGGAMGDGNVHSPHNLPIVLVGSGGGSLRPGRHVRAPFDAPFMNLCLTLLDKFDARIDAIGDSTGRLEI